MANSLLDFVISLVRDPEAAARYAANPAQTIADAHLVDVTSADVNNLIPMVADSLSMGGPTGVASGVPAVDHGNVWASGAAAAALDAFSPSSPAPVVYHPSAASGVINQPAWHGADEVAGVAQPVAIDPHEPSALVTGTDTPDPTFDHSVFHAADPAVWDHHGVHPQDASPDHHGFGVHG